jgi:hypothetical protein
LATPSRRLLAHFVRCVTDRAAHDGAKEGVIGEMAGNPASDRAFDAAFGDGDVWGERDRQG